MSIISGTKSTGGHVKVLVDSLGRFVAIPVAVDANGAEAELLVDAQGNLQTDMAGTIEGEDTEAHLLRVEQRWTGATIAATTIVKAAAGVLAKITVLASADGVISAYNTAAANTNNPIVENLAVTANQVWDFGPMEFSTGLRVVLVSGTATLLVCYR